MGDFTLRGLVCRNSPKRGAEGRLPVGLGVFVHAREAELQKKKRGWRERESSRPSHDVACPRTIVTHERKSEFCCEGCPGQKSLRKDFFGWGKKISKYTECPYTDNL